MYFHDVLLTSYNCHFVTGCFKKLNSCFLRSEFPKKSIRRLLVTCFEKPQFEGSLVTCGYFK